jgi:hypothetical protein
VSCTTTAAIGVVVAATGVTVGVAVGCGVGEGVAVLGTAVTTTVCTTIWTCGAGVAARGAALTLVDLGVGDADGRGVALGEGVAVGVTGRSGSAAAVQVPLSSAAHGTVEVHDTSAIAHIADGSARLAVIGRPLPSSTASHTSVQGAGAVQVGS